VAENDPIKSLNALLTSPLFSRQNAEKVARVCYDTARLVYERQKQTGKSQLKTKEVSDSLTLAQSLHSNAFRFIAEGPLIELFGGCDQDAAVEYFAEKVMGNVKDKSGRTIVIDEDALKSIYKDPESGRHEKCEENYEEVRGKRLPWVRYTIDNSDAVYMEEEPLGRTGIRRKFFYTAIVTYKHKQEEHTSYYVVLVREEAKSGILRMVTAFPMFDRDGFLHAIAMSKRYVHENKENIGESTVTAPASKEM